MSKYIYGSLTEYEEEWDRWQFNSDKHKRTICRERQLIEALNMLGEDGWQLVLFDEKSKEYVLKKKAD